MLGNNTKTLNGYAAADTLLLHKTERHVYCKNHTENISITRVGKTQSFGMSHRVVQIGTTRFSAVNTY